MSAETAQGRLVSLDVFRGMTIAGMVLVNNPGVWGAIYPPLMHAEWHGITPTDYIFPFFLFIVGVAIPIALGKRIAEGITRAVYLKIIERAAIIFGLGYFMGAFPLFDFTKPEIPLFVKLPVMFAMIAIPYFWLTDAGKTALIILAATAVFLGISYFAGYPIVFLDFGQIRIPGVLQRIGVCYLVASLLFLHTNWKQLAGIGVVMLLVYWLLMTVVPVPGCDVTTIDSKACNLAAYLDRTILTEGHLWRSAKVFDPEGILSTIPAIVTTIAGILTGLWIRTDKSETEKAGGLLFAGVVLCAVGWCWNPFFPFNKALWTSSYVVYTAGLALCFLGFCYWLIDIKGYRGWTKPFVIFGMNALALFVGSGLLGRIIGIVRATGPDGKETSLQGWIFQTIYLPFLTPINASLFYALSYIGFWLFLMWLLYRKRIYIKV